MKRRVSDLIVETWVSEGNCGVEETEAVEEIAKTTERPAETEDEVVTLHKAARASNIIPHILELKCDQYRKLIGADGELDAERLLVLVKKLLAEKAKWLHQKNVERNSTRTVVIYGGAVHNDVDPKADLASFSFAYELDTAADGRYVELDLFVPELIAGEEWKEEPWYPYFQRHASAKETLLIETSSQSYALFFPRPRSDAGRGD
jgi:hypothetical protein